MKRFDSYVSGKIARTNPLEGGPAFDAAVNGSGIKANTWGGYATALMDLHDLEPQEALDLLGITYSDIADPTVHFFRGSGFDDYYGIKWKEFLEEAKDDLRIESNRLVSIIDTVMDGYKLPDQEAANNYAYQIQCKIDADQLLEDSFNIRDGAIEDDEATQLIRCMHRDALYSGVRIPLQEFVTIMLSCNVLDEEYPSELANVWLAALRDAVEDFWQDYARPEFTIDKMIAGRDIFDRFKYFVQEYHKVAVKIATERWKKIEPVFVAKARSIGELAIVTGKEVR